MAPQEILENAILTLENHHSVEAVIRHKADLFGSKPVGSGIYQEERAGPGLSGQLRFRQELRVQVGQQANSLVHVCDGRYLWKYQELGRGKTLTRIDVLRVQRAMEESGDIEVFLKVDGWPGLGGLAKLLRGLHAAFDFHAAQEGRLAEELPVWKLEGQWKKERLAKLLPDQKEALEGGRPPDLSNLPGHLPDHVVLFLRQGDGFPCRIEYRRRQPDQENRDEGVGPRSILTIEFVDVKIDVPIHHSRFAFSSPSDVEASDETREFLKSLGLER